MARLSLGMAESLESVASVSMLYVIRQPGNGKIWKMVKMMGQLMGQLMGHMGEFLEVFAWLDRWSLLDHNGVVP